MCNLTLLVYSRVLPPSPQFNPAQSLNRVRFFASPWSEARQASLSTTNSWSLLKLMSIKLVMSSNHPILCRPLLLLPSLFATIRVFSKESFPVAKALEPQLQY